MAAGEGSGRCARVRESRIVDWCRVSRCLTMQRTWMKFAVSVAGLVVTLIPGAGISRLELASGTGQLPGAPQRGLSRRRLLRVAVRGQATLGVITMDKGHSVSALGSLRSAV